MFLVSNAQTENWRRWREWIEVARSPRLSPAVVLMPPLLPSGAAIWIPGLTRAPHAAMTLASVRLCWAGVSSDFCIKAKHQSC